MNNKQELETALESAGIEFNCDKVEPHHYHKYYAKHLDEYIGRPFKLLEIGIGGEGREIGGASLKLWERVFPLAEIHGLDIYPKTELDTANVKTHIVDQGDAGALQEFVSQYGPFDVIIDDGSHRRSDQLTSLFNLIGAVVPGGYYILEDYFTSYWPVYDGSTLAKDFLDTPVRWLKSAIDIINRNNLLSEEMRSLIPDWQLEELHVYPGVAFMKKGLTQNSTEIPLGDFSSNQLELDELRYGKYRQLFLSYAQDPTSSLNLIMELRGEIDAYLNTVPKP
jgi:hypothetical protein